MAGEPGDERGAGAVEPVAGHVDADGVVGVVLERVEGAPHGGADDLVWFSGEARFDAVEAEPVHGRLVRRR